MVKPFEKLKLIHPMDLGYQQYKRRKAKRSTEEKLLISTKSSAYQRGLPHEIEVSDIVITEFCPVFGTPMKGMTDRVYKPSVDRIDSTKGYVKGNICVISMHANRLKNNASIDEMERILTYMRNHRG